MWRLAGSSVTRTQLFAQGRATICEGIAFHLDPQDAHKAYAVSPSSDISDERLNVIVEEVVRIFPKFLAENPDLEPLLRVRQ